MRIRPSYLSLALCAVVLVAWMATTGCHRSYYRRQADNDARMLIREKLNDTRWSQIDPTIEIAPDSRMYDPFSADHPPMPNDDRASHEFMHCVDDKPGYQYWHVNGDTTYVANPVWRAYLPLDEQGVLKLDLDTSVTLSLIHSSVWQQQRENLYLSALDVSLERFGFDMQAVYGLSSFFRTQGRNNPGGSASSVELTPGPGGRTRIEKLGISGANLVVGIANTVIWNFAGANTQSASTLVDFSLIQPLLRGEGRQIVMESLTQAERDLLADVRQLERFRRGFNLSVVTGRSPGAGPRANLLGEPAAANFGAGGFIGLLQTQQQIRIAEFNVRSLENVLAQFREFFTEQRINLLQVRSVETTLYSAQDSLLRQRVAYQDRLDQFKRDLGLPPDLQIEVEDPFLAQFEVIDDTLLERQLEVTLLRDTIGEALSLINPNEDGSFDEDVDLQWSDELEASIRGLLPVLQQLEPYFALLEGADRELVEKDFGTLESVRPKRLEELSSLRDFIEQSDTRYEIEPSVLQPESVVSVGQLDNELQELQTKIALLKGMVIRVAASVSKLLEEGPSLSSDELKDRLTGEIIYDAPEVVTKLADAVIELTLIQARARTNSISLPEVEIASDAAWSIACQFRRDLMNARAALVDQWRQIELAADDLESTLDVVVEGSVGTTNGQSNPFKINWTTNQFGMGLRFDAPITRLAERNQYRQTLINYQRARRDYYNFEDSIKQNLRETIRAIDQSKVVFELNRRSIGVAVEQVELARFDLIRPVRPGQGGGQGTTLGPTAANDLTRALDSLQRAQNSFLDIWVSYEVARRGLDFDLGTMQLTPEGYWLDPGTITEEYAYRAAEAFGIPPESICLPPDITFVEPGQNDDGDQAPVEVPQQDPENFDATPEPSLDAPTEGDQARRGLFGPVPRNAGYYENR